MTPTRCQAQRRDTRRCPHPARHIVFYDLQPVALCGLHAGRRPVLADPTPLTPAALDPALLAGYLAALTALVAQLTARRAALDQHLATCQQRIVTAQALQRARPCGRTA